MSAARKFDPFAHTADAFGPDHLPARQPDLVTYVGTPSLSDLEASLLRDLVHRAARAVGGAWTATWRLDGSLHVQDAERSGRISVSWSGVSLAPPKGRAASPEATALALACRARLEQLHRVNPERPPQRFDAPETRQAPRPAPAAQAPRADLRARLAELAAARSWTYYGVSFRGADVEWSVEPAAEGATVNAAVRGVLIGSFGLDRAGRPFGVVGHVRRKSHYDDVKAPAALVEVAAELAQSAQSTQEAA